MDIKSRLRFLWIVIVLSNASSEQDPCTSYTELNTTSLKTDFVYTNATIPFLRPGWFRYTGTTSGAVATSCPASGTACGSKRHIWTDDTTAESLITQSTTPTTSTLLTTSTRPITSKQNNILTLSATLLTTSQLLSTPFNVTGRGSTPTINHAYVTHTGLGISKESTSHDLKTGQVAGIVVGCLVFGNLIVIGIYVTKRHLSGYRHTSIEQFPETTPD